MVRNELGDAEQVACGALEVKVKEGTLAGTQSAEEYQQTVHDLVNFMAYLAEPIADERKRIGIYVFLFLGVLLIFTWLLNREYWKDVH